MVNCFAGTDQFNLKVMNLVAIQDRLFYRHQARRGMRTGIVIAIMILVANNYNGGVKTTPDICFIKNGGKV
jgi:hypothetical protein